MQDDRGVALVMVIVLGFISVLLLGTALTAASSGLRQAVTSQRSTSALDAAFAGVQEYVARVNADDSYVAYGNALSPFTIASGSAATVKKPDVYNAAMGAGGTVASSAPGSSNWKWTAVPGSGGNSRFRYEIDNSAYKTTGTVRLRVTGAAGDSTRTLLVNLRVRGFVDYSYFTDLEMQDPVTSGDAASCAVRAPRPSSCKAASVKFLKDDAISGDVHSNDLMTICGATFTGRVTTYYTGNPLWSRTGCPTGTGTTSMTNISHADELPLPPTNTTMEQDAACVYVGPTQVTYNPGGTMTVVSPWTRVTSNATRCGSVAQLGSPSGATVSQLDHDALYVKAVPLDSSDPNYRSSADKPANLSCVDANGSTTTAADGIGWQLSSGGATIRYPRTNEVPATIKAFTSSDQWDTTRPAYGCRSGDLYLQGTVTGQTTAAAANYVYVTGDVVYADRTANVLGIVGQNGVIVWNPMKSYSLDLLNPFRPILTDTNREIDAAILSTAHTFSVQNFDRGTQRGVLKVYGSIGQKFRGIVAAQFPDTGYDKSYEYDPLLKTVSPPKFLAAGSTTFTVSYYAAVAAAFKADGSNP
ncbi:hypothetical protein [Amnibacterium endophyticum]|uniref:Type 4 fimbrial biogenesis protein PilX N-terminal domain-containing protein n=1 Tax=Amnibacterium endophyticum TaxID=2109337 RepID=A0ABW4LDJ8_9MICO